MTALICCLLLMAGWYGCGPAPLNGLMCLVSTLLSFLLFIHFSDSPFDSIKPNNQSKWCLSPTVGHGASVCKICFTTTFQWCGTPVWPGISMPIALSKSPDSWGLCAVTLISPLWFKWPLTKTQTVVKTKTVQFQVITREAVLQGASPWKKAPAMLQWSIAVLYTLPKRNRQFEMIKTLEKYCRSADFHNFVVGFWWM